MPARLEAGTEHSGTTTEPGRRGASAPVTLATGVVLAAAVVVVSLLDALLDLQVGPVVLAGAVLGAVVALVPAGSAGQRLGGFVIGVVVTLVCYLVRAATLPDTSSGLTVMAVLSVLVCTAIALASLGRLPLWTLLLGAGSYAAVYERTFAAAVAEAATTSVNALTALALTAAVGFLAASLLPQIGGARRARTTTGTTDTTDTTDTAAPAGAHSLEATR